MDRKNFGLTLDFGHLITCGENPAQSVAMVGKAGKLFGVQLNDGFAPSPSHLRACLALISGIIQDMVLRIVESERTESWPD